MTANRGLFVRATGTAPNKVGTTPVESRLALAGLLTENLALTPRQGVMSSQDFALVAGNTSAWSYHVQPSHIVLTRAANEGAYIMTVTGIHAVTTDPAPATGSRWDIIYAKQNDVDKGDANNLAVIDVVKGTAASSPTKPAVPNGALALAEARIYAATSSTTSGSNTMTQVHPFTNARGSIIPVRDLADRATISMPQLGQQVMRLDRDSLIQTYTGENTSSGWEWLGVPRRYYADTNAFASHNTASSRAVYTMTEIPTFPYATKMRANGRLGIGVNAIGSGIQHVALAVSIAQGQVTFAQGKSRIGFVPPGNYTITTQAETGWVPVGASGASVPRLWLENITGAVGTITGPTDVYAHFWVEVLPADD